MKNKNKYKKSKFQTKDFKKLQLKWYIKIDKMDFNDIERSGKNRQKYLDEYSGILQKPLSTQRKKVNFFTLSHLNQLKKFALVPKYAQILQPKLIILPNIADLTAYLSKQMFHALVVDAKKVPKQTANQLILQLDRRTASARSAKQTILTDKAADVFAVYLKLIKPLTLNKIDRCILTLTSNGIQLVEISKHLRRYYRRHIKSIVAGRKGNPFSICYVHNRLKRLNQLMRYHQDYQDYVAGQIGEAGEAGEAD
jgi:hypothetical protein